MARFFPHIIFLVLINSVFASANSIITADLIQSSILLIEFEQPLLNYDPQDFSLYPPVPVETVMQSENKVYLCFDRPLNFKQNYKVIVREVGEKNLRLTNALNCFYSEEPLGCYPEGSRTSFALFAPRATQVVLELYSDYRGEPVVSELLKVDKNGIWKITLPGNLENLFYGYRISGPEGADEQFNPSILIADPYSKSVITQNDYHHRAFSRITKEDFDWEGDTSIFIDPRDLIIYELHLRDFTAHPSSDLADSIKGSYLGLIEKIGLFKDLGVNAVELLPVQEFANLEVPYNLPVAGWFNSWNPYACNYWGTAPDYFFTPEAYYASGESLLPGEWSGLKSDPVRQFKEMVKALHKQGIAVIMQMVYDHTSQYDLNPLKYVDKKYYYNLDQNNECLNHSGYGDDLNTSRPMVRRLMMDSLKRWIRDFHIDGFQFNSANMIDKETLELVLMELRRENPEIIIIAEAGAEGKENLAKMSDPGFSVLNNLFANTIRGQNPEVSPGFIFGEWSGGGDMELVKSLICGNSISAEGDFQTSAHTVNYLEVHNGYTLGDFIRIGSGEVSVEERITNIRKNNRLSKEQGALNRLAALILLVSRGAVMVAEGQEYARSKVIVPTACPDPNIGRFDHNSYNKDNFTNWINYDFRQENNNLVEYYRKLIKFRKNNAILRYAGPQDYRFFTGDCEFSLGFQLEADSSSIIVLINANQNERAKFTLPTDNWKLALAEDQKLIKRHQNPKNSVSIEQVSGVILYLSR